MLKAAQAYFQTQVSTTSQGDLVVMLYDGAIKFLTQAKDKIKERDYAGKGILISKAIDVISELDGSLNIQKGGDLAENLHNLYFFCNTRLLNANMNMDVQLLDDVIKILQGLRSAFAQISNKSGEPAQAAPPAQGLSSQPSPAPRPNLLTQPPLPAQPPEKNEPDRPMKTPAPQSTAAAYGGRPPAPAKIDPAAPEPGAPKSPNQPNQGRLRTGSNIYRKIASQT